MPFGTSNVPATTVVLTITFLFYTTTFLFTTTFLLFTTATAFWQAFHFDSKRLGQNAVSAIHSTSCGPHQRTHLALINQANQQRSHTRTHTHTLGQPLPSFLRQ